MQVDEHRLENSVVSLYYIKYYVIEYIKHRGIVYFALRKNYIIRCKFLGVYTL